MNDVIGRISSPQAKNISNHLHLIIFIEENKISDKLEILRNPVNSLWNQYLSSSRNNIF
jgi:hypothetical protein